MDLLSDGHQTEFKLLPRLDHPASLIANMLERRRDIDFFTTFRHPVEYHIDEDVRTRPTNTIAAVYCDWARSPSVTLVHFPPKFQQGFCYRWNAAGWPRQEMELGHRSRFPGPRVFQVDRPH